MITRFDPTGTIEQLERILARLEANPAIHGVVVFASEQNPWDQSGLKALLSRARLPVTGGIFPALIHDSQIQSVGTLVLGFENGFESMMILGADLESPRMQALLEERFAYPPERGTLLVVADSRISEMGGVIEALFEHFGLRYPVMGGGAGSASHAHIPCVFMNGRIEQEAIVLAFLPELCSIAVQHGWNAVGTPMWVTRSTGNTIRSLDCQNAVDAYVEMVTRQLGHPPDGLCADWSAQFPLGLHHPECEPVVRDPVECLADGSLVCFGDIPEGSRVQVLRGDSASLIRAAESAFDLAAKRWLGDNIPQAILVFDCLSRVSFLGDRISGELCSLRRVNSTTIGAITIGEIASVEEKHLEFWNKSIVVAHIGD